MKTIILSLLLLIPVWTVAGQNSSYHDSLRAVHDRFSELEMLRADYRKPKPSLTPDQEQERLRLHGQLLRDDPVWAVQRQLYEDMHALEDASAKAGSDKALLETLKNLLGVVDSHDDTATTRAQAEEHAMALRLFVIRRDYEGAKAWSERH